MTLKRAKEIWRQVKSRESDWCCFSRREQAQMADIMYFGRERAKDKIKFGGWLFKDGVYDDKGFQEYKWNPLQEKSEKAVEEYLDHAFSVLI